MTDCKTAQMEFGPAATVVLNALRISVICEALHKSVDNPAAPNHLPQKQASGIGRNIAAIERRHHSAPSYLLKLA